MDEIPVEVTGGPFAGFPAVLLSRAGNQVRVEVTMFGRRTPVDLRADQVRVAGAFPAKGPGGAGTAQDAQAVLREQIRREHERLAATEEFAFFLERAGSPDADPAAEWDAYLRHRAEVRTRTRQRERAALDRFDADVAPLPPEDARRALAADAAFWQPGTTAAGEQQARFPDPAGRTAEERLLAAVFADPLADPPPSPVEQARERLERARLAADERDHERWRAGLSAEELSAQPSRGNPGRYAYARAGRRDAGRPGREQASAAGTGTTPGSAPGNATARLTAGGTRPAVLSDAMAAELRARFRSAEGDHALRARLEREMLAGRRLDLVQDIVDSGHHGGPTTVLGLLLPGGAGDVPFPGNPWNVPRDAGLTRALAQVWRPVADHAPRFVRELHERTLGLALLGDEEGAARLAYLMARRADDGLSVAVGSAPRAADPAAVVPQLAGPVPRPVREFWAVHQALDNGMEWIGGGLDCNTLEFFEDDSWSVVAARLDGLPPDRFVHAAGGANYDTYLLDLDVLDGAGSPTVARWAFKERQLGGRQPYWEWFEGAGRDLILGH